MEAATALHRPFVRLRGDRVAIDGLVLDDACLARLVRDRESQGEDPAKVVGDAVEIGARVLDREHTAANTEWVKAEFEKVSRDVESAFSDKARSVAEHFGAKVDEVFGPENGHLARALERHFSDGSSAAVQHRVRELVSEVMAKSREDLLRQFSAADGSNPLAEFKSGAVAAIRQASDRQDSSLRALLMKMGELEKELQGLRDERQKQLELAAERDRGTAKGRSFEEAVHEAIDAIAAAQGDDCDAVGDLKGATRRTGDIVVGIEACRGPARGRIVFEAKTARLSKPEALRELDRGLTERDADFAVLVVPSEEKLPARMLALREYNGDKLIVAYDPEDGLRLGLEVAYSLARARVLLARSGDDGVDADAVQEKVERALAAMDDVRRIKSQLTGATTSIESARSILEAMAEQVRAHLSDVADVLRLADQAQIPHLPRK
jgi:hypothetical protein